MFALCCEYSYPNLEIHCSSLRVFVSADAISAVGTATTDYSDQCINLAMAARDVGKGQQLYAVIVVTETFVPDSTVGTVTFHLVEDVNTTITSGAVVLLSTEAFVTTTIAIGRAPIVIPVPSSVALQYLGMSCTFSEDLTDGTIDAFLTTDVQTNV